jgi:hypothetical protein
MNNGNEEIMTRIELQSTLPLTIAQITERSWHGNGEASGRIVLAHIQENEDHSGFFDCRAVSTENVSTKRAVAAELVPLMMETILQQLGCRCSDLSWRPEIKREAQCANDVEIVYFLSAGGFIKIGTTRGSADSRIRSIQTGCPFPIEVLGVIPGGASAERALHSKFSHLRTHGEWFFDSEQIRAEIARERIAA